MDEEKAKAEKVAAAKKKVHEPLVPSLPLPSNSPYAYDSR